jgi:hypothetical protein
VIPQAFIVELSGKVGWPTPEQVEQDLILSRLILEIANDPYLGPFFPTESRQEAPRAYELAQRLCAAGCQVPGELRRPA